MAKQRVIKSDPNNVLKRIVELQQKVAKALNDCVNLGKCHLDIDEEQTTCNDQMQVLNAVKAYLFPDKP